MVVLLIDNTKTIMEKKELIKISERDNLTYLYNRSKLDNMIETEYVNLRCCGILFFDINNLKEINDCLGHNEGDECIIRAAEAIRSITNRSIHAYRYGGDEFVVFLPNVTKEETNALADKVKAQLAKQFPLFVKTCNFGVSLGAVFVPEDGKDWDTLFKKVDETLYENKRQSKMEQHGEGKTEK